MSGIPGLRIACSPLSLLEARLAGHGCQGPPLLGVAVVAVANDDRVVVIKARRASAPAPLACYDLIDPARDAGDIGFIDTEKAARRVLSHDLGLGAGGARLESIGVWFARDSCVVLYVARLADASAAVLEDALAAGGGATEAGTREALGVWTDAEQRAHDPWDTALIEHLRSATPACEDADAFGVPVSLEHLTTV